MRFYISLIMISISFYSAPSWAAGAAIDSSNTQNTINKSGNQPENPTSNWANTAQEILMDALSLTGTQYKFGGKSPETGFDCSGFVRYVFQQAASMTLPHSARAISQLGQSVAIDDLQPGDLVFFNTLKSAFSHVGIYMGNNRFIHAPSSGGGIHIVDMSDSYWAKRFNGARRLDNSEQAVVESVATTQAK